MPMVQPPLVSDPFAAVAWDACVSILALQKLMSRESIRTDEMRNIAELRKFVASLIATSHASHEERLWQEHGRRNSYFLAHFGRADLGPIERNLEQALSANPDTEVYRMAQEACLAIVKTTNRLRPR